MSARLHHVVGLLIGVSLIAALAGVTGYALGRRTSSNTPVVMSLPSPSLQAGSLSLLKKPAPSEAMISTDDWRTYANDEEDISFRYPVDATLTEGKLRSVDGVVVKVFGLVHLDLPLRLPTQCASGGSAVGLTIVQARDPNDAVFGDPNVFSKITPKQSLRVGDVTVVEATGPVPGLEASEQIGVATGGMYYLIKGEPCFSKTARRIVETIRFSMPSSRKAD